MSRKLIYLGFIIALIGGMFLPLLTDKPAFASSTLVKGAVVFANSPDTQAGFNGTYSAQSVLTPNSVDIGTVAGTVISVQLVDTANNNVVLQNATAIGGNVYAFGSVPGERKNVITKRIASSGNGYFAWLRNANSNTWSFEDERGVTHYSTDSWADSSSPNAGAYHNIPSAVGRYWSDPAWMRWDIAHPASMEIADRSFGGNATYTSDIVFYDYIVSSVGNPQSKSTNEDISYFQNVAASKLPSGDGRVTFEEKFDYVPNSNGSYADPTALHYEYFNGFSVDFSGYTYFYPTSWHVVVNYNETSTPSPTPVGATSTPAGSTSSPTPAGSTPSPTGSTPTPAPAASLVSLSVTPATSTVQVGQTTGYTATAQYSDSSTQNVTSIATWSISNTAIATINNTGFATGVSIGNTAVIATWNGKTGSAQIIVPNGPRAIISAPAQVYEGDNFYVSGGGSYSPNGPITDYTWSTSNAMGSLGNSISGTLWYDVGFGNTTQSIYLGITDNLGNTAMTSHQIAVLPATITARVQVTGNRKVNRKITVDASTSYSPSHYPIDFASSSLTIIPLDSGTSQTEIKQANSFNSTMKIELLVKKPGNYRATLNLRNTLGLVDNAVVDFTVAPDLAPTANFTMPTWLYLDPTDQIRASIPVSILTDSSDFDTYQTTWTLWYNTNFNYVANPIVIDPDDPYATLEIRTQYANFVDEIPITFTSTQLDAGTLTYTIDVATISVTKTSFNQFVIKSNQLGRYKLECSVQETWTDKLTQFVSASDYLSATTLAKPILEKIITIDHQAPTVDFQ